MLRILMGRARTGKSERILREIAVQGKDRRCILLVPEHASHMAEVDLCTACGDTASRRAEVLTFKLLASRVLSRIGGSADVTLERAGKLLTLQRTLQELSPKLSVYRRPSQRAAFLESLLDVIEELSAYAVPPETLAERVETMGGESGDKLRDIALIYGIYLAKLHAPGRDARDRLEKLEENLVASGYIDGKIVYIDGFSYFTGRELNILRILLLRASAVTVTLLGDESDRELFAESLRVRDRLVELSRDAGVPCMIDTLPEGACGDALAHVERYFFGRPERWAGESDCVRLHEASNAYAEAEWAAAEILRLVRSGACRFRDIAVTARQLSSYEPVLESVFARCGVPLYTARRSDILQQGVLSLLLGALDAASGGFEYEDVFRCLKTGLAGITPEECDVLENYALKWDIRGAMWTREKEWAAHPDGYGAKWDDESRARLAQVNALRLRVRGPFSHLTDGIRGTGTAEDKVKALYNYLEEVRLPEALQTQTENLFADHEGRRAEEMAQLWSILCDVMDQFVSILGDQELDAEEFARLFRLILTQYSVGTIPAALDQVSCTEMTRNDRHAVRALFLLGANDGVLPETERRGGVLREEDRAALEAREIRLAPYGLAQFRLELQNLYAALAAPTERLYVSYPLSDAAGAELRPSFVVGRLQAILPRAVWEREDPNRQFRLASRAGALEYAGGHIDGAAWQFFSDDPAAQPVLAAMRAAAQYTRGALSPAAVRTLYGGQLTLSASRMDLAKECHFAYFMRYGLRAKERTSAGFDAPQTGTFVHDVMENTLRRAAALGGIKAVPREELHRLARVSIEEYIARELPDLAEKSARFRYLFERLCEGTERIIDEIAEELTVSDFTPLAFELSFGPDGELPAIALREGRQDVRIVGKVDRVDGWVRDGKLYLRVVDYKTGKKSFDLSQVRYGLGLQMLLYLFALGREGKALFGREIVPAGVLYTPARETFLKQPRDVSDAQLARALRKTFRRSGMVLGEPEVLRAMEHTALDEPAYLPVAAKRDKDGNVQLSGSIATSEQLGQLGQYVDLVLREITREIAHGNVDADPCAFSRQETACTYCAFAPACHFEPGQGRDRMVPIRSVRADEFWSEIGERLGKEAQSDG